MPRAPKEHSRMHAAADKIEPHAEEAFEKAVVKMQRKISIDELAQKIAMKDVRGAMRLLPMDAIEEALSPLGTIIRDATVVGGKLAADEVNEMNEQ